MLQCDDDWKKVRDLQLNQNIDKVKGQISKGHACHVSLNDARRETSNVGNFHWPLTQEDFIDPVGCSPDSYTRTALQLLAQRKRKLR